MVAAVASQINLLLQERMIMKCPVCENTNLMMSERQGIEIDYCPQCRGVWLDRGELDKIIERSVVATPVSNVEQRNPVQAQPQPQAYPQQQPQSYPQQQQRHQHQSSYGHQQQSHTYHKKKKEGFLSELFDFD
jgi:Zn-finger nucleic acid-binding protein